MEKAIIDKIGMKPQKASEDRQKFLERTMLAIQKLPEEKWEELAAVPGAQDWYNSATEADNDEKDLPDFPDVAAAAGDAPDDDADDAEDEAPAKPAKASKSAKAKANGKVAAKTEKAPAKAAKAAKPEKPAKPAKAAKAAPAEKPAKGGKVAMKYALKLLVVKNPRLTVEDLMARLEKAGYASPSRLTVSTFRADTRGTIKALNEAGLTNIEL